MNSKTNVIAASLCNLFWRGAIGRPENISPSLSRVFSEIKARSIADAFKIDYQKLLKDGRVAREKLFNER
jgi:hypothetical protein